MGISGSTEHRAGFGQSFPLCVPAEQPLLLLDSWYNLSPKLDILILQGTQTSLWHLRFLMIGIRRTLKIVVLGLVA